ncbi:6-phosphogluconate dehydrogenase (decarboxylating) [Pacificibacter maritimus]|uniref:6-phosphogluconate dehydrogenase, decarboxylating n=1 Tax=Pacificibacter maritimus TaxID=762213 RepID=A0A3N4UDQ3_9RHOB|nr:NADP-dependent phosphogluconate dehydrogenase [Pacificibacter maritimus]RPE66565.1 6-phosphogluconate dehydrogenase (decarboxylating) [Pacificibacter maritimus]
MTHKPEYGLIGLGTMGAALALNIAEKGNKIAVYNRTTKVTDEFIAASGALRDQLVATASLKDFVAAIQAPRKIILMVPAGPIVDAQIEALVPLLDADDLIIDAGNAHYADTNRRFKEAETAAYNFLGIGVSGGEEGARHGPSIMVGGAQSDWEAVAPVLRAISAKYEDTPCAEHMGAGGAGHYVKMVHNGIEYADMQMIAEAYAVFRDGLGWTSTQVAEAFEQWNTGPLASYLVEISGKVSRATDPVTGKAMLDVILDQAGQKGTGRWTAIEAQMLGVPVPVIEAAVAARNLSAKRDTRIQGAERFGSPLQPLTSDDITPEMLEKALTAGKILCYAQGFEMLDAASRHFEWSLPMSNIARVWREGCIIRSDMLGDMAEALDKSSSQNLIFSAPFCDMLMDCESALRATVLAATKAGIPVPALAAGLSWFDTMRTARTPANMIQAQRDFFGAHGFKRLDDVDAPHGPWAAQ